MNKKEIEFANLRYEIANKNLTYAFIGGKQIGVECLKYLIELEWYPSYVIVNKGETGVLNSKRWHDDLYAYSKAKEFDTHRYDEIAINKLIFNNPDIVFCIGGMHILPEDIVAKVPCINIHPALLPKYRGRYSIPWMIFNGEAVGGTTIHYMNKDMDAGDIIKQSPYPITQNDTSLSLWERFTKDGLELFKKFVSCYLLDKEINTTAQVESNATYTGNILPNNGIINPEWNMKTLDRFLRAMYHPPHLMPVIVSGDKKFKLEETT